MIPIAVKAPSEARGAASAIPENDVVPSVANAIMMAKESPISPTRFMMNAFFDAVA